MIPRRLRLRNFMSYGEDVPPLDFSQITTACMTGDNGHGKSTLLDAITWALWGQTRAKNIDDVVRLGQTDAEVEFEFELESERYRVIRKRSLRTKAGQSSLELQGFDTTAGRYQAISGNSIRETEAKIVQLLHMDYDTFINSVFVLQGRADEFTTRRPTERKRILAEILGLSIFDELEVRARARRNELDQDVKARTLRLDELQQEVARKDELATAVQAQQDTLAHLQTELHTAQERLDDLRQRHSALELQRQRAAETARRLQQIRHELLEIEQQLATHRQRLSDYQAVLQQEPTIMTGYQELQRLQAEERAVSARAEEYAMLQQRLNALQHTIAAAQHRLEVEQQSAQQRQREIDDKLQGCDTILQDAARITRTYTELQEARQREAQLARTRERRYTLEQEKHHLERQIQQKRHALELEQRSLLDRQKDWEHKQATLPTWQRQIDDLRQRSATVEQQAQRLEQVRHEGVSLRVQVEERIPQSIDGLQKEIHEHQEKRTLLNAAAAQCPLCEKALTDTERRRVMHKLAQEITRREARLQELKHEQQQLQARRLALRTEYRQLEQQVEQRQALETQIATAQANLEEAMKAHDHLVTTLTALQDLEARLSAGTYASAELSRLQQLTSELTSLAYDSQEYEAVQRALVTLSSAEVELSRLRQVETEVVTLREQRQRLTQQAAQLEQTLQSKQFAVAEQQELRSVQDALGRLDFAPATLTALRQRLYVHQHFERQHVELEAARKRLHDERVALQGLEARQQRCTQDSIAHEQEQRQFASDIHTLEELRRHTADAEVQLRRLRQREGDMRLALGRAQSHYEHCLQREAEWHEGKAQREQLVTERTLYGDLVQMFGKNGIQALIIENAIPELEEVANQILARVSDNAMHLTLETQRDTRSGNVAETLDIKISDTLGTRSYEMFSGGEAFRINFALRIALSKMLARRAGAPLRTLVIDEGFGTQDSQGLERLVEVIKAIQHEFAKIIVITHLRDLKNAFDTHIEVKKDPVRGSWYQVL
jgi:exonuclease SbcC